MTLLDDANDHLTLLDDADASAHVTRRAFPEHLSTGPQPVFTLELKRCPSQAAEEQVGYPT
ncbi:hypothetical protein ACFWF7_29060 [Nocardia sp. NPDC060256]|uniref:hypothetical protein n=1 Tax=unclassified Nocardia TaxID=2637762 RepID=UPI0036677CF5